MGTSNPRLVIDVESRGTIELELLAREAPLTVANFLRLVDQRYFDGEQQDRHDERTPHTNGSAR